MQTDPQPALEPTRPVHLVIVPHTHWDREWYQPFQQFRARLVRLMERLLDILERDPAFRHFHLDGQTIVLEDYLEIHPGRRVRLRRLIGDGRIAVGPWYVLPDEFLVSGESLIRNLQIGHRLAGEFGSATKIGYLPDEFGHAAQLPQILAGFGIDSSVVWRGVGADVRETLFRWEGLDGSAVFTVYLPLSGYSNGRNLPEAAAELRARLGEIIAEQAPFRRIPTLLVLNGTDHQEPQAALPAALEAAMRGWEGVTYEIAPVARFIARAREEQGELHTHRGELRSPRRTTITPGVTSVRVRLKQRDFDNTSRLERYAEPLATWADLLGGDRQLAPFLEWAWKRTVQNHPHDSITGCSVDQVHRDMESRFDQVQMVAEHVLAQALAALIPCLDTMPAAPHAALVVYNPNGAGPGVVTADLSLDGATAYELVDGEGRTVPFQVEASASEILLDAEMPPADVRPHVLAMQSREFLGMFVNDIRLDRNGPALNASITLDRMERGRLDWQALRAEWLAHLDDPSLRTVAVRAQSGAPARGAFVAPHLTGHGFTVFALRRAGAASPRAFGWGERAIENEFFAVRANEDGSLRIEDKQTGLVLPRCSWLVDEGDRGDEYNFDAVDGQAITSPVAPPAVAIDAGQPVVATLTVTQIYELPRCLDADRETRSADRVVLPITTVARLYSGVKRIDFETIFENTAADHRLRVHFQTPLAVESAFMEQAFGTVERPLALEPPSEFEHAIGTVPQKTFTCMQDGARGVALFNRGIPEIEVRAMDGGSEIALTLIRAVGWLSRSDLRSRRGPAGPGLETPEAQSLGGHRFAYALTTFAGDWQRAGIAAQAHAFAYPPLAQTTDAHAGPLSSRAGLIGCDNSHVILSALTAAKRPDAFVARWYNSTPNTQAAVFTIPSAKRVRSVNFLEQPTRLPLRHLTEDRWRAQLRPFQVLTLQVVSK
jgi:Glycosyl hydrolases family 38 N-terminal domain/Glycosyl hydrolases family 38 C-terminal domain/Alpha mannosidase middle domain/Glycosyl hydrolases family 38 C-terminal beta sandwich domain